MPQGGADSFSVRTSLVCGWPHHHVPGASNSGSGRLILFSQPYCARQARGPTVANQSGKNEWKRESRPFRAKDRMLVPGTVFAVPQRHAHHHQNRAHGNIWTALAVS